MAIIFKSCPYICWHFTIFCWNSCFFSDPIIYFFSCLSTLQSILVTSRPKEAPRLRVFVACLEWIGFSHFWFSFFLLVVGETRSVIWRAEEGSRCTQSLCNSSPESRRGRLLCEDRGPGMRAELTAPRGGLWVAVRRVTFRLTSGRLSQPGFGQERLDHSRADCL